NDNSDYQSIGYDTSTASLSSSINEYVFENGRRYHAYFGIDKNPLPTDTKEQERLDLHHEIMFLMFNGELHKSPLKEPHRVLDVGTGTGIWAIGTSYPMAEVIGIDLSPIQPVWVPGNCRFEVDDAETPWTYREEFFDFIHCRNISQGISNWDLLMTEIYRCTIPGGHVELSELAVSSHCDDGTMKPDNGMKRFTDLLSEAMVKMGRPPLTPNRLREFLEKAGFVDIKVHNVKQPIGPWPKDPRLKRIGAMVLLNCETAFESYGMALFTRVLGMDAEAAQGICDGALEAVRNKNNHIYSYLYCVHGRKPGEEEH
ncbi:S-adenosyl-L-methionine-dependent methyltransferase, partial [Wilcoxina mikolae CBS 423.85]